MASEVEQLRQEIQAELSQLQLKLAAYGSAQKEAQEAVASQLAAATLGLQELYAKASGAIGELKARVEKVVGNREMGKDGKRKSLIQAKDLVPDKLAKQEEWKTWRSDVEDYCEEQQEEMKAMLEKVRKGRLRSRRSGSLRQKKSGGKRQKSCGGSWRGSPQAKQRT